jgi:fatty acyl-CoA reductase
MGAKHICEFAKRCNKLKMLLHVSTGIRQQQSNVPYTSLWCSVALNPYNIYTPLAAYVAGEQEGILPEKPFLLGETLREGVHLDIESELNLIQETRREVEANCYSERVEKRTMKELGLKRLE